MGKSYLLYGNVFVDGYLTDEEQMKLLKMLSGDDDTKNIVVWKLALANIGLIHKVVDEFLEHNDSIPYDDLMSLGILGTINAIKKYDSSKGIKLSTFIYVCAKRSLKEFEKSNSVISIKRHFYSKISIYNKCIDKYYVKYGDKPSLSYIKSKTGLSESDISLIRNIYFDSISLSEPIDGMDGDVTLEDCIPSSGSSIQQIIELRELRKILRKNLDKLSDVEIKILWCRYGLGNNRPMTQEEVAKIINCSRQNISKLERKALTKLRKFKELRKAYYA